MSPRIFHAVHEGPPGAPELVLLHGWGLHSGVWDDFIQRLTPHCRVHVMDLPGFGRSAGLPPADWVEALLACAPARAVWLGWSLGGLLALELALRHPARVQALSLMATTPCFVQRPDWPMAMAPMVFAGFRDALRENPRATLESFLALQCKGSTSLRADLRFLRRVLEAVPLSATPVLLDGLHHLEQVDLRSRLAACVPPLQLILGEHDGLVPASVGAAVQACCPQAAVTVIPQAAHIPFVSHPAPCLEAVLALVSATGGEAA